MPKLNTDPKPYPVYLIGQQYTAINRSLLEILPEPAERTPRPAWYKFRQRQGLQIAYVRCIREGFSHGQVHVAGAAFWTLIAPKEVQSMERKTRQQPAGQVQS